MRAYEEYEEGFEKGKEVATETSLSEEAQKQVDILMGRYDGKSKMWWRGFNDGKEGNWDPCRRKMKNRTKNKGPF